MAQNKESKTDFYPTLLYGNQIYFQDMEVISFGSISNIIVKFPKVAYVPLSIGVTYSYSYLPTKYSYFRGISLNLDLEKSRGEIENLRTKINRKIVPINIDPVNQLNAIQKRNNITDSLKKNNLIPNQVLPSDTLNVSSSLDSISNPNFTLQDSLKSHLTKVDDSLSIDLNSIQESNKSKLDSLENSINDRRWFESRLFSNVKFIKAGTISPTHDGIVLGSLRLNGLSTAFNIDKKFYLEGGAGNMALISPIGISELEITSSLIPKYNFNTFYFTTGIGTPTDMNNLLINYVQISQKSREEQHYFAQTKSSLISLSNKISFGKGKQFFNSELAICNDSIEGNTLRLENMSGSFAYQLQFGNLNSFLIQVKRNGDNFKSISDPFVLSGTTSLFASSNINFSNWFFSPNISLNSSQIGDNNYYSTNSNVNFYYQPGISFRILGDVFAFSSKGTSYVTKQQGLSLGTEVFRRIKSNIVKTKLILKGINRLNSIGEIKQSNNEYWLKFNQGLQLATSKFEFETDLQFDGTCYSCLLQERHQLIYTHVSKKTSMAFSYGLIKYAPYLNYANTFNIRASYQIVKNSNISFQYFSSSNYLLEIANNRILLNLLITI